MRTILAVGLLTCCLSVAGCMNEGAVLTGPTSAESDVAGPLAAPDADAIRIIVPRSGAIMSAGVTFNVRVLQELRDGPSQARGQLQFSVDRREWTDLGDEFPWSRQAHEFRIADVLLQELGRNWIRLVLFEQAPESPFAESSHVDVICVERRHPEVAVMD